MKLKTYFPQSSQGDNFGNILERSVKNNQSEMLFLVCAEYRGADNSKRLIDFYGLDFAFTLEREESPMIICSYMPETYFLQNEELAEKFITLTSQPRVCFMQLPFTVTELEQTFQELLES